LSDPALPQEGKPRRESMVSTGEILEYIKGIDFPQKKQGLIEHAKSRNAPANVIDLLNKLPDMNYRSTADVNIEVGKLE